MITALHIEKELVLQAGTKEERKFLLDLYEQVASGAVYGPVSDPILAERKNPNGSIVLIRKSDRR